MPPVPSPSPEERFSYAVGDVIAGKYALEELLGIGGMGAVFRARNMVIDMPVAIKLIRADLDRELLTGRLLQEARAAAKLTHPAIVRVFFFQDHAALLDERARTAAREFRGGLEGLVAQGKADGLVRSGGVDALAAAWLGVVRVAMERIVTREWGTNSGGVTVCREAAWAAIAQTA